MTYERGGARPPAARTVAFIKANKDEVVDGRRLGVAVCRVLQVAQSTYYAARNRAPSARVRHDAELVLRLDHKTPEPPSNPERFTSSGRWFWCKGAALAVR